MHSLSEEIGLDGFYKESELPLLLKKRGMAIWSDGIVQILDRRQLPLSKEYITCETTEDVADAIESMVIQGAFSISIAAGYGLALTAQQNNTSMENINKAAQRLLLTRPTGLALSRVIALCLKKSEKAIKENRSPLDEILYVTDKVASDLAKQARKTAEYAISLIKCGDTILTHCFPDRSYAYLLVEAKKKNMNLSFLCSETRPYMQGTKLTSLCSSELGFETHIISDGMGGALMQEGSVDLFITAADRVCMDGSIVNKIGTYQYALAADANNLPYYVLRQSGPDIESLNTEDVIIEKRSGDDLVSYGGKIIAPSGVKGLYPAFDITPPHLVNAIITDRGVFKANQIHTYQDTSSFIDDSLI
jgi:methylthioribose-1-phosphate isomerase